MIQRFSLDPLRRKSMNGVANRGGWPLIWENGEWAAAKVASIVAGMLAGADRIDDLAVLREGPWASCCPG